MNHKKEITLLCFDISPNSLDYTQCVANIWNQFQEHQIYQALPNILNCTNIPDCPIIPDYQICQIHKITEYTNLPNEPKISGCQKYMTDTKIQDPRYPPAKTTELQGEQGGQQIEAILEKNCFCCFCFLYYI